MVRGTASLAHRVDIVTTRSETLRTFIALPLPDEWIGQLAETIAELSRALPYGVRWVSPSGIHLTLKFLGATDARIVPRVMDAIADNFAEASPPLLSLSVLGTFPGGRNPRVIWAGVSGGAEGLEDLHHRAEQAVSGLGWSVDGRPFRPHLTLGRGARSGQCPTTTSDVRCGGEGETSGHPQLATGHGSPLPERADPSRRSVLQPWRGANLMETTLVTSVRPVPPYDFELTAGQPNYSREQQFKTEEYVDGCYIRLLDLGDKVTLAKVRSVGAVDAPELTVELTGDDLTDSDADRAAQQITWLLGCDQDLRPFYDSVDADPVLADVVHDFYGYHNTRTASVYEALVQAVMGQQIATNVARIIRSLLVENYGVRATIVDREWYAFPRAESLAVAEVDDLRQLKLSYRKAEYIQGIARTAFDSGDNLDGMHDLEDDEVVKRMVAMRGVGQWTAQWVLVRALARPDGFPIGDLALRRTVSSLYFDGAEIDDRQLLEFSERWSPWRSYATSYLFAALRTGRIAGS